MPTAIELLRQGRNEELWQMCCGFLNLDIRQFMAIQNRLLLGQIQSLNQSKIGKKIFNGAIIRTIEDFRERVPLTDYSNYSPEFLEKKEDTLPEKPIYWIHTSGCSGEYSCKWIPVSSSFVTEMSRILYGIGIISSSKNFGDISQLIECPNMIYTVAPRPYISGAIASMLEEQTPVSYFPSLPAAENLPFEERIKLGFDWALSDGLDYFFGLSVVLADVGDKIKQSAGKVDILPLLSRPKALLRLTRAIVRSRLAGRNVLPKDIWNVRGIITSGLDSSVYKEKIKEYWGRYPLDIYANTEGGVIATQTWDYGSMTFIPNLNYLEFIPEKEYFKWQSDHKYQPRTVLLDEVKAGENYEIVITSFHGGALIRYRIGDMIRITSLRNENLNINIPQMVFERRADDLLDFATIRLSEKTIWNAIECLGISYRDWIAFKKPGELTLNLLIELGDGYHISESDLEKALYNQIMKEELEAFATSRAHMDAIKTTRMDIKVTLLPRGAFTNYIAQRQAEGADIAHLKPPHVNPTPKVIGTLLNATTAGAPKSSVKAAQQQTPVSFK